MSAPRLPDGVSATLYALVELERELQPSARAGSDRDTIERLRQRILPEQPEAFENLRTLYRRGRNLYGTDATVRATIDGLLDEARRRRVTFGPNADPITLMFATDEVELAVLREKMEKREAKLTELRAEERLLRELRAQLRAEMATH